MCSVACLRIPYHTTCWLGCHPPPKPPSGDPTARTPAIRHAALHPEHTPPPPSKVTSAYVLLGLVAEDTTSKHGYLNSGITHDVRPHACFLKERDCMATHMHPRSPTYAWRWIAMAQRVCALRPMRVCMRDSQGGACAFGQKRLLMAPPSTMPAL
jgi:hypothetical protein